MLDDLLDGRARPTLVKYSRGPVNLSRSKEVAQTIVRSQFHALNRKLTSKTLLALNDELACPGKDI